MPQCIKRFNNSKIKNWVTQFLKNEEAITKYMPEFKNMDIRQKLKFIRFEIFEGDIFDASSSKSQKKIVLYIKNPMDNKDGRTLPFDIVEFKSLASM